MGVNARVAPRGVIRASFVVGDRTEVPMTLTRKRKVFVEEYLKCWNGTKAARRAGYAHPSVQASRLLRNVKVQEVISKRLTEKSMSADEVLIRLADMARGDIRNVVDLRDDGSWSIDWAAAEGKTHVIKSVRDTKHGLSVEMYDALSALEKIGRAHGLFRSVHEHTGEGGGPIEHQHRLSDDERLFRVRSLLGADEEDGDA